MKLKSNQQGLTLMEILVTMFILAVGLLGIASMQVRAVQDSSNANFRSLAIFYANDMADRIRANTEASGNYSYAGAPNPAPSLTSNCLSSAGCSASEMAANDIGTWLANISDALPGGIGSITAPVAPARTYTVRVEWTDRVERGAASTATSKVTLTFEP